jgi:predicted MFS family arabinose efflux permease
MHRSVLRSLIISNLALYFGFGIWQGLFNNFAVQAIGIRADQIGIIQSVREIPGLLGFWLAFLALVMAELKVLSLSTVVMGIGLIAMGMAQTWTQLIFGVMVTSIGFHAFYPFSSAVALMVSEGDETPHLLGLLQMLVAVGAVVASLAIILLVDRIGFSRLFYVGGALTIAGGIVSWSRRDVRSGQMERPRIVLRRRYWLYYVLTLLLGSRRHIFTTFAIFLLVKEFGMPTQQTAILYLINSVLGVFLYRRAGALVARFGERPVLAITFVLLITIFIGYATIDYLPILAAFFVVDNFLFGMEFALQSYFKKIAVSAEEITSNLTLSQTINHLAAVFVPLVGGIAWEMFDPSVPFLAGVVIVLACLGLLWFMRPEPAPAPVPAT